MRYIDLIVSGHSVTEWSKWESAEIVVSREEGKISVGAAIEGVQLLNEAYDVVNNAIISNKYKPIRVTIRHSGVVLAGVIDASRARWGQKRMVVDIELDELSLFERDIAGMRPRTAFNYVVALEREGDRGSVAASLASCLLLIYAIVREIRDLKEFIANTVAHAAGGAPGPVAAAAYKIAVIAIRAVFIAVLGIALWNIITELFRLLPAPKTTRALNLGESIRDIVSRAGYRVLIPSELDKIWLAGDNIDTIEATELILLAAQILNARIYMYNRELRFSSSVSSFPLHNTAYTEMYSINTDEFAGYNLISLSRDYTDRFTIGLPHAIEIIFQGYAGFNRIDIPYATCRPKLGLTDLDRLINIFYDTTRAASKIFRRPINRPPIQVGSIIVGNEYIATKIIMADALDRLNENTPRELLWFIADRYTPRLSRVYERVRIPFAADDYARLAAAGFRGVKSLKWNVNNDWAEVDYNVIERDQPDKMINIV